MASHFWQAEMEMSQPITPALPEMLFPVRWNVHICLNVTGEAEGPHGTQSNWEWVATAGVIPPVSNILSVLC